jgi:outer membrane lipoprotein LolB
MEYIMKKIFIIFIALNILMLSACSNINNYNKEEISILDNTRKNLKIYSVNGKLAILSKEKISTYLNIDVKNNDFNLYLSDFSGSTILKLEKSDNMTTIYDKNGNIHKSKDANKLVKELTQLSIPVDDLPSILVAEPLNYPYTTENNLIKTISLNNYTIEYNNYDIVNEVLVPTFITIKGQDIKLKIKMNSWKF